MDRVWYFAYGANMSSSTLRERRGVVFRQAVPARVKGWRLVLDKPSLLPIKEAFANIVPDAASSVLGVLFEVTNDDLDHIELTEGVRIGNYHRAEVDAGPLSDGAAIRRSFTLTSERRDTSLRPSAHYMGLLIEGATEHALPGEYVDFLRSVPTCTDTTEAAEYRSLLQDLRRRGS